MTETKLLRRRNSGLSQDEVQAEGLIRAVTRKHGISPTAILISRRRSPRFCAARHEAMAAINRRLGWSLPRIGEYFRVHHTSVLYAVNLWRGLTPLEDEPPRRRNRMAELEARVAELERIIREGKAA